MRLNRHHRIALPPLYGGAAWLLLLLALTACAAPPAVGRHCRSGVRFGAAGLFSGRLKIPQAVPEIEYSFESTGGLALAYEANFDDRLAGDFAVRYLQLDWEGPGGGQGDGDWLDGSAGLRWYLTRARDLRALEPFLAFDMLFLARADVGGDVDSALGVSAGAGVLAWLHSDLALDIQTRAFAARGAFTMSRPAYRGWSVEVAGSYWF